MGQRISNTGIIVGSRIFDDGTDDKNIVVLAAPRPSLFLGSSRPGLAADPEQLASWSGPEGTWVLQSQSCRKDSVMLKPGSLYRLPADQEVQCPESTVTETVTLKPGCLCRRPAGGEGGAEQRGEQEPRFRFIFPLPDEATLKAVASVLKSLDNEHPLEELWERVGQSGAKRKAAAELLCRQPRAGEDSWSPEDMELFLDALESAGLCKLFQDEPKVDSDPKTGGKPLSQSGGK
ncbi:uncharacterized protein LOC142823297 isoform X1 [Pelodiscus sinensis]|uniref:uncharacterized protein LOC142823297 isoform X1 n=2 Tax=Pelodiscus sinensis TaxID=13735 RepID=UPI003F6D1A3D